MQKHRTWAVHIKCLIFIFKKSKNELPGTIFCVWTKIAILEDVQTKNDFVGLLLLLKMLPSLLTNAQFKGKTMGIFFSPKIRHLTSIYQALKALYMHFSFLMACCHAAGNKKRETIGKENCCTAMKCWYMSYWYVINISWHCLDLHMQKSCNYIKIWTVLQ